MTQKRMDIWQIWSMRDNGKRANIQRISILYCIVKQMDSTADDDYREDRKRRRAFYEAYQERHMGN